MIGPKKLEGIVEAASKAFWEEVDKQLPDYNAECLDPGTIITLQWQMKEAITRYIERNIQIKESVEHEGNGHRK